MKELKELGFEYMPTLNEFRKKLTTEPYSFDTLHFYSEVFWSAINLYGDLIDKQPKLGDFIPCIDGVPVDKPEFGKSYPKSVIEQYQKALEQVKFEGWELTANVHGIWWVENKEFCIKSDNCKTYEQAINDGVKFKIK